MVKKIFSANARAWVTLTGGISPIALVSMILWIRGAIPSHVGIMLVVAAAAGVLWAFWRSRHIVIVPQAAPPEQGAPAPLSQPSLAEQALRLAFHEPLLIVDRRNRIVEANRAATELLGSPLENTNLALSLRHPAALSAVAQILAQGGAQTIQMTLSQPVDQQFDVHVAAIQPPQAEDAPDYVLVTLRETTEIRRAEQMRVDFVANASHELRTPLASLVGFIETLQGAARNDPESQARFLKIMGEEAARMARLIEDLLSLSKIEQDEHVQPGQEVALAPLLAGISKSAALRAEARGMKIEIETGENLPPVAGDRDQLVQVFQNLVENAIKYAAANTVVRIGAVLLDYHPDLGIPAVEVRVIDQGEGIAPEHLPRLTERFYRVDKARSRSLGGTGLGLAIVKHIVNRHRGQLDIESKVGVGTIMIVALPAAARAAERQTVPLHAVR